ncbi:MAG: aspartate 1-decarboxylase [Candidatus Omnitrophica bacterium]|nr:aspartate 1-decarboxylase [Candidatus Omnitrophota bacterium]
MLRSMCKSKLHGAVVTEANIHYRGSIGIDTGLLEAADIMPFERVQIVNVNNGQRLETYVIAAEPGSGTICMNGGAARWAEVGDKLLIISYALMESREARTHSPKLVFVDEKNQIAELKLQADSEDE